MIFELHFGSVYLSIYVSMYVCMYLSPGKFKFFESAGITSLALEMISREGFCQKVGNDSFLGPKASETISQRRFGLICQNKF